MKELKATPVETSEDEMRQELDAWRTLVPGHEEPDRLADYIKRLQDDRASLGAADEEITRASIVEANLADYAKRYFDLFDQYRHAWLREMGGVIRPKSWEIDGFVLRARDIYEKAQLVDRIKQIMVKSLKEKRSAEEMFDDVFKMLAENGRDKIPTN